MRRKIAAPKAFRISFNFPASYFNSSAPSKTIRIRPTVPNKGRSIEKSYKEIPNDSDAYLSRIPSMSNISTEGILVRLEKLSNRYEKITSELSKIKME